MYYRVKTEAGGKMKASWERVDYVTGVASITKKAQ